MVPFLLLTRLERKEGHRDSKSSCICLSLFIGMSSEFDVVLPEPTHNAGSVPSKTLPGVSNVGQVGRAHRSDAIGVIFTIAVEFSPSS